MSRIHAWTVLFAVVVSLWAPLAHPGNVVPFQSFSERMSGRYDCLISGKGRFCMIEVLEARRDRVGDRNLIQGGRFSDYRITLKFRFSLAKDPTAIITAESVPATEGNVFLPYLLKAVVPIGPDRFEEYFIYLERATAKLKRVSFTRSGWSRRLPFFFGGKRAECEKLYRVVAPYRY